MSSSKQRPFCMPPRVNTAVATCLSVPVCTTPIIHVCTYIIGKTWLHDTGYLDRSHRVRASAAERYDSGYLDLETSTLRDNRLGFVHDDVIKWKHFPRYWPFVRGIHRSPVNSPHKGQWRGALMLSLVWAWLNGWVYNREAGDLRRYRAHYDVTVMNGYDLVISEVVSSYNTGNSPIIFAIVMFY